jgi:signal peptidase I
MKQDKEEKSNLFVLKLFFYFWLIIISFLYIFPYGRSEGPSMLPTAEHRSFYISIKHYYNFFEPNYGDIISFNQNKNEAGLVKRVVGLPGDSIYIIDNTLYVNDKKINNIKIKKKLFNIQKTNIPLTIYEEKNHINKTYNILKNEFGLDCVDSRMDNFEKISVPKDHYFVLGDNRYCSSDSRNFGPISKKSIKEKILFFYKPKSYQSWDWEHLN